MTEEEENGVVKAEDKSEPEDLNELEEEIIQVTSSEAREDSGKSGSRYCSHSEIHQAREDCRFVSGQSIRSSVSSMQSSTLQPKYGAGEDVRSKETEEANSSAPITSYKPPEDSGKSGSRHCSHSENNQTKKSHRVVSDDSVSPSKSQTEPIAQSEYDDLLDEVELLLDDPSEETDWDAENELIETIEAEEDEGVENYADDLSGSSSSSLAPTQEFEPNEANSTHPTVQKKTGQIDYTHPFDLLFDQPTEEIDWDRLIAAMKRSFGESGDEGKRETTPSTHSFASGHREPEENRKRNSVCGLKSEEVVGQYRDGKENRLTEEMDIAGYGLSVSPTPISIFASSPTSFYVAGRAREKTEDNPPILIPSTTRSYSRLFSSGSFLFASPSQTQITTNNYRLILRHFEARVMTGKIEKSGEREDGMNMGCGRE